MVFKLMACASKTWRTLNGSALIPDVIAGVQFVDGERKNAAQDRARNLGQVYAATGRPSAAIEQYEQVLAKKPDDKGCKMAIASCRMDMGDLDVETPIESEAGG